VRVQLRTDAKQHSFAKGNLEARSKVRGKTEKSGDRPDGSNRDSMLYSIIPSEWPTVRQGTRGENRGFVSRRVRQSDLLSIAKPFFLPSINTAFTEVFTVLKQLRNPIPGGES